MQLALDIICPSLSIMAARLRQGIDRLNGWPRMFTLDPVAAHMNSSPRAMENAPVGDRFIQNPEFIMNPRTPYIRVTT